MRSARRAERDHDHDNSRRSRHIIPPRIVIPQKVETLNRRISNLEAIDPGVFTGNILASFLALPGLVGFWPMSSVQRSTGNAYDLSGQSRTLTYNGNPAYTYYNGLVPYIDMDGTGDYLSRADETDLDIQGNETIFTTGAAGLTMGGWFWSDSIATQYGLMGKYTTVAGNRSYWLQFVSSQTSFSVSDNGTNSTSATLTTNLSSSTWYFCVGRFTPSTEVKVFTNAMSNTNTSSIPATIFSGTGAFQIGALNATLNLNGRASLCFLCANALGDDLISSLYSQSRVIFSV